MKLTAPQQKISDDAARFRVVAAGRRFGKSYLAINELAKFSRYPNSRTMYIATTYRQAKTVIWEDLKSMLFAVKWIKRVNESDLTITLVNNSTISVRSSDNKDALRGSKYDFIVLDEFADMDPDTWFTVLRPTLSDRQGHALFIGSPKGRNHFYDMWVRAGSETNWSAYQYTTLEGGNVDPDEIEQARRDLDERQFQQEYCAQFVDYAGVIYYAFSEENVVPYDPALLKNARMPLHIGIDFNIDPMSAIIGITYGDTLHVIDEVEIYGSNTNEVAVEIKRRFPHRVMYAYPDASGAKRSTNGGLSDHIILNNSGFTVKTLRQNPPVVDRINAVNTALCNSEGIRRLLIDPKCKKLRECLIKHTYKEGTRQPNKDGYDHMLDALGYWVYQQAPIRRNMEEFSVGTQYRRSGGRMNHV